jgi:ribosome-associated protein
MPDGLRVGSRLVIPEAELSWRFSRSSGPGGQGVNTTDSRVELTYDVAGSAVLSDFQRARIEQRLGSRMAGGALTLVASEHRSQLRNRDAARSRLAALLADALAPPPRARRATRPTRGSVERRLAAKKRRTQIKKDRRRPTD